MLRILQLVFYISLVVVLIETRTHRIKIHEKHSNEESNDLDDENDDDDDEIKLHLWSSGIVPYVIEPNQFSKSI